MQKQRKEIDRWKEIRLHLNKNYNYSENWKKAVEIFQKRIEDKYLKPIEKIIKPNLRKGEGFTVVTVQCALIETFAAFREGQIFNHNKPEEGGITYEYKDSRELFVNFLNSAKIFEKIFFNEIAGVKQQNTPFSGESFYSNVRCGLMHEAKTKKTWHINATKDDNPDDEYFIKQKPKGNIIYRTPLHYSLVKYFNKYCENLNNSEEQYNNLRRKFARKLDDLYELNSGEEKQMYEWWDF